MPTKRPTTPSSLDFKRVLALVAFVVAGALLWDQPFLRPLKLLVVMMHESGHALATLLFGGSVDRITIATDESGQCLSRLPVSTIAQIAVYSAGYVGSTIASGLLLIATFRLQLRRWVLGTAALWLGAMGVLYAGDATTLLFCLGMGAAFALGAKWLPEAAVDALNLFIASFSALYAVRDLRDDLWNSSVRGMSDAALLAQQTHVPAVLWALLWTVGSLALLILFVGVAMRGRRSASGPRFDTAFARTSRL